MALIIHHNVLLVSLFAIYLLYHWVSQENAMPEKKVIVAVRQGNLLGTAFHPELTADSRWYIIF